VGKALPEAFCEVIRAVLDSGVIREVDAQVGDRTYTFFLVPFPDSGYANVYAADITERKQAENRLQEQMEENFKRAQELETIVEISAAMRRAESRPEMMALLLEQSLKTMGAQAGALGWINGNRLIFQAAAGQAVSWEGKVLPQGEHLFWEALREGCPRFVEASSNDHDPGPAGVMSPFDGLSPDIQAGFVIPLKSGAAKTGVLFIGFCLPIQISNTQKRLAAAIADMAGNALHRMSIADALEKLVADRTRELETIYKVTAAASQPVGLEAALQSALDPVLNAVDARTGAILLVDDENGKFRILAEQGLSPEIKNEIESAGRENSLEGWVLEHKQPLLVPDLAADPRLDRSGKPEAHIPFTALPMRVGERIVGILEIARPGGGQFDMEELTLLSFIADHLGLVIENAHLVELAEQNAVLEERSRLARELHDSVTQTLYSLNLFAGAGKNLAASHDGEPIRQHFMTIEANALQALKEMRLLIYELRPAVLDEEGLTGALQKRLDAVERRSGMKANLNADENLALPGWMEAEIYRIAEEALNNVLKHARASRVDVSLKSDSQILVFKVVDDGVGFDLEQAQNQGGHGLASLRERVEKINGRLTITSSGQSGTEINVEVKR
jgi:signal transduction histidine kinase